MAPSKREQFGSSFSFIMAVAGSAIGLGNIWRFPYMVGEHGGGAFIVAYIICCLFLAVPCFVCEAVIGRRGRSDVYGSLERLAPKSKWKWLGGVSVFAAFVIVSFYCVVGGWSLDFLVRSLSGRLSHGDPDGASILFKRMSSGTLEPLSMYVTFLLATALIVIGGIKKGIERFTKITTPLLFFLMVAMVIYSVSLPGASAGVEYLVRSDFSKMDAAGWACALGQAFFSMSLGIGAVLVYSSFMKKEDSILKGGLWTAASDTFFAIISGFAIMPAVFAAGFEPSAGPSLVYETLPFIFAKMGIEAPVLSWIMTMVFFLAILSAALTSSISMFEVCIEYLVHRFGIKRWQAAVAFLAPILLLGVPCVLSFGPLSEFKIFGLTVFDLCDFVCSNVLMTLGALAFAIFVGWRMKRADVFDEFTNGGTLGFSAKVFRPLYFFVRWLVPPIIIIIFISNLL